MGLDCQTCTDQQKEYRGCVTESNVGFYINGEEYKICPIRSIPRHIFEYLRAYNWYQKGFLPNGNMWLDESEKFLQAMNAIDTARAEIEQEEIKKAQRYGKH